MCLNISNRRHDHEHEHEHSHSLPLSALQSLH